MSFKTFLEFVRIEVKTVSVLALNLRDCLLLVR